jgi:hypothetical protein
MNTFIDSSALSLTERAKSVLFSVSYKRLTMTIVILLIGRVELYQYGQGRRIVSGSF